MAMTAASVVLMDQLVKELVRGSMVVGERRDLLGFVDLVSVRNKGVAFGAFSGHGWLVPALTLFALGAVLVWFARRPSESFAWFPSGLVVGGAVGNLLDRLVHGAVTDFIKLPHWPAFNIGDMAITAGVLLLVVTAEVEARDD